MKILAAILGVVFVAAAAAILIPRLARTPPQRVAADGRRSGLPEKQIETPRAREEELREELSEKRLSFFRDLRNKYGDAIQFAVLGDPDTLDVVVEKADTESITSLVAVAIAPTGRRYGFRRVKFYTRNPKGSVEPLELRAEASYDETGHWNTFKL